MSTPKWPTRMLALLQLLLVLPPLASGSVCISSDGMKKLELGFCACMALPACEAEAAMGATGTVDCGPCRDEVFTVLRSTVSPARNALTTALPHVAPCVAAVATPFVGARSFWAGEPPGKRLPILRC
jgi:hypothetical protein